MGRFGWFGFNCGAMLSFNGKSATIGRVAVNTLLSSAMGGVVTMVIGRIQNRDSPYYKWNLGDLNNGILAGLVAVTGGCAFVQPWAAICIGTIASFIYKGAGALITHPKIRIDDPLDAVPVHCCCGLLGIFMPGFFAYPAYLDEVAVTAGRGGGAFYGYGANLGIQCIEFLVIFGWTVAWAIVVFSIFLLIDKNKGSHAWFLIRGKQFEGIGFGLFFFFDSKVSAN